MTSETRIRKADSNDISLLADLVRERWYLKIGFVEGETKEFDHLPFLVLFMTYAL